MSSLNFRSLEPLVEEFVKDYSGRKVAFVMMRFADSLLLNTLYEVIQNTLSTRGWDAVRADRVSYSQQLWTNVETCLRGADAGIAVIDRIPFRGQAPDSINANVLLEAGYMLGLDKPVLLLMEQNVGELPVDLGGMLYRTFDGDNPDSAGEQVRAWATSEFG